MGSGHPSGDELVIRHLTTIDECQQTVPLQREVWGVADEDVVPASLLIMAPRRGGVLAGAFDGNRLVGLVCSLPGLHDGRVLQWSHMLGVAESHRGRGLGRRLKLEQRQRTLAMGIDLIQWTFDPLQVLNARLNICSLGALAREYEVDAYGATSSPLHRGAPTDRLVADWWIRSSRVEAALREGCGARPDDFEAAAPVNRCEHRGGVAVCTALDTDVDAPSLLVSVPSDFGRLMASEPDAALEWRLATRQLFVAYLGRGYVVTGFRQERGLVRAGYLLARHGRPQEER